MHSLRRQRKIYIDGLAGHKPATPVTYAALEAKAKDILSPEAFAYLAGGAGNETTMQANRAALDQVQIHPRMLGGVQEVSMFLKWRAHTLPAPFILAPIGVLSLAHHKGDLAVASACAATQTPMTISSQASFPMEVIADHLKDAPRIFQLYHGIYDDVSKSFIRRAEQIQCSAIIVTLDTTLLGWRTRDLALGYSPFLFGKGIAQYTSDPAFNALPNPPEDNSIRPDINFTLIKNLISISAALPGNTLTNLISRKALDTVRKFSHHFNHPGLSWSDIEKIRSWTKLPVYLKGILHEEDAENAVRLGLDGIIISNHGGRQIDGSVSTTAALMRIAPILRDKIVIWMDSGIRSGSDIYKCIALGATGVLIGRPHAMALACNGTQGVIDCIENFKAELELTMALTGVQRLDDIRSDMIITPSRNM